MNTEDRRQKAEDPITPDLTFDPDQLQWSGWEIPQPAPGSCLPRARRGELFFHGPIPLDWLAVAAALPGRSFQLAMAAWFEATRKKRRIPCVTVKATTRRRFGLTRYAVYHAERALERAGLIRVERRLGRPTFITILPAPGTKTTEV